MKNSVKWMLAAGLVIAAPVLGKSKAGDARKFVTEQVKNAVKNDSVAKPTKTMIAAAITQTDLNRDGVPDFVVNFKSFNSPGWCGTGGCRYQLWLGTSGNAARIVFDQQIREVSLRQGAYGTIFDFDFHGGVCGKTGSEACPISFAYDTPSGAMMAVPIPGKKKIKYRADPIDPMYSGK